MPQEKEEAAQPVSMAEHAKLLGGGEKPSDPKTICIIHGCPMVKEGKECPMLVLGTEGKGGECPFCKKHLDASEAISGGAPQTLEGYSVLTLGPRDAELLNIATASETSSIP